jgi:Protein of unknown function (DUF2800)
MTNDISHGDRAHALLSASSAKRWLACTPSARLGEQFEDKSSFYSEEGTLAHEIAELKLRKYMEPMSKGEYTKQLNKLKKTTYNDQELYQKEMLKHTDTYLDYIKKITMSFDSNPYVAIEKRINYSSYAPEGFGTVDCLIIGGDKLYVTDFKYGKGLPVSAEENEQMKLYALGAVTEYGFLYPIKEVHLAIIQPRLDSISEFSLPVEDLLAWGEEIKPIAENAFKGEGEFVPGEHCKFCKVKATCRARADEFTALEDFGLMKPPLISNEEVGKILEIAQHLDSWVKALKDHALSESLKGNEVAGWKAVEGRGSRNFVNQDAAFEHLKANEIDESLLYDRVPLTVPKIEKQLGKKEFRTLLEEPGHVQKTTGKPTLAPANDKRKAVSNVPDAGADFDIG